MRKVGITIVSGFLGAGKTTFIKKMIGDLNNKRKIAIIENEFGEVGIDGRILKDLGMNVMEINSGCICCSVSDDFRTCISNITREFDVEDIIIEPSGVAKLSEIEEICMSSEDLFIKKKVTIVDPFLYESYSINFGDFYNDQIKSADIILFSRYTDAVEVGLLSDHSFISSRDGKISKSILLEDKISKVKENTIAEENDIVEGENAIVEKNDIIEGVNTIAEENDITEGVNSEIIEDKGRENTFIIDDIRNKNSRVEIYEVEWDQIDSMLLFV